MIYINCTVLPLRRQESSQHSFGYFKFYSMSCLQSFCTNKRSGELCCIYLSDANARWIYCL